MKLKITGMILLATLAAGNAHAAFERPTRAELKAAAEDLSKVVELLEDASIDQAAEVAKDVVIQIVKLGLDRTKQNAIQQLAGVSRNQQIGLDLP